MEKLKFIAFLGYGGKTAITKDLTLLETEHEFIDKLKYVNEHGVGGVYVIVPNEKHFTQLHHLTVDNMFSLGIERIGIPPECERMFNNEVVRKFFKRKAITSPKVGRVYVNSKGNKFRYYGTGTMKDYRGTRKGHIYENVSGSMAEPMSRHFEIDLIKGVKSNLIAQVDTFKCDTTRLEWKDYKNEIQFVELDNAIK